MFDAVSLDIETLDIAPGGVILSIGMVEFNTSTGDLGEEFFCSFYEADWTARGYTVRQSTRDWWIHPDRDKARPFLDLNRKSYGAGLYLAWKFLEGRSLEGGLWSRGYMDETMLALAIRNRFPYAQNPWPYRAPSDARTLMMTIGRVFGPDLAILDIPFVGVPHHALDDARHEAKLVSAAHKFLRSAADSMGVLVDAAERRG